MKSKVDRKKERKKEEATRKEERRADNKTSSHRMSLALNVCGSAAGCKQGKSLHAKASSSSTTKAFPSTN
jgi:hypothetical protein